MGVCASGPQWTDVQTTETRRLHAARSTAFDATKDTHQRQLRAFWRAMLPASDFKMKGAEWQSIGFQGEDPTTDIRSGGFLSVECLEHFATFYTDGVKQMLTELRRTERQGQEAGEASESFYPLSTTAIVLCSIICDAVGISAGMLGPLKAGQLDKLLTSRPKSPGIVSLLSKQGPTCGFNEMFSFAFAKFHVRFLGDNASYLASKQYAEEAVAELEERAVGCDR